MIKLQIGKLTFKNFILHWIVAILLTIKATHSEFNDLDIKTIIILVGTASLIPGMLASILLISFTKGVIEDIKNKDYKVVIATIILGIIFTKYFLKI